MDKDFKICGREQEIKTIHKFVAEHISNNDSGIMYLTGPPGTGKTMSVDLVLDEFKDINKLRLNCFKAQSSRVVLTKLCSALDIKIPLKPCETQLIDLITKKLSGRTCKPFLLVLDEMDKLPRTNNSNFVRTIFSWTKQSFSRLVIIGIANTVNLTARSQAFATFVGSCDHTVTKIIFKPYNSKDIQAILNWYLENDENFEDADVDAKAIELISKRIAKEKGDIRTAIDTLRDTVYDSLAEKRKQEDSMMTESYPTPPSTPPPAKFREKTNLTSVVNSTRKRQRESHFFEEKAPPASEILLICLMKLCSATKDSSIDSNAFYGKARDILNRYGTTTSHLDVKSLLEQLEAQGTIAFKKRPRMMSDKIMLKASESEITRLSRNKQIILDFISAHL